MTVLAGGLALVTVAALAAWRPGWSTRLSTWLVPILALAGGGSVASGGARPTGWIVLDVALAVALGAAATLAAAHRGPGWTLWLAAAAIVALVLGEAGGWEPVGAAGIGVAVAVALASGREPVPQAAATVGMLAVLSHLSWPVATGASSLLMVAALLPLLLAGLVVAPRAVRRAIGTTVALYVLVAVVGAVAGGIAALSASTDVDRAVDAAVAGLDRADADDPGPAIEDLRTAADSFESAEETLRAWWARPALLVPGVAQHSRAVSTMADAGGELAAAAATSLEEVDLDLLKPVAGRIDPTVIAEVEPPLSRALVSLRAADRELHDVRSPLLVGPVAERLDDLVEQVADARRTAETASSALAAAPELLGVDRPQRYFLVMQTPSELRGVGGFMGSWGELVIDDGRFELARTGRVTELTQGGSDPASRRIEGHPEFVAHWGQAPAQFWGLIGFSPDFPTVASIITQLYPQSGGGELDGVIGLDPAGFAALLELTGPITVDGYDGQLTPETAEQVLLHDQYLEAGEADREAFLEAAIRRLFDELTAGELPGPSSISAALAPMVDGRHIQLYAADDRSQRFFRTIGADGSVERRAPASIGVVGQNYNGNKIDWFLRRTLTYDVSWDPSTGRFEGTVELRLQNLAPSAGLPHSIIGWGGDLVADQLPVADGENLMYVSLYSAAPLSDVTVDGEPAELNRVVEDLGHLAYDTYVRVPAGGERTLRATVEGQVAPGRSFHVDVLRQVTASPDRYRLRVRAPGWELDAAEGRNDGSAVEVEADATRPVELEVEARPEQPSLLDRFRGLDRAG